MDIAGAKALKERLGLSGAEEATPAGTDLDITEDAPPLYRWLGVSYPAPSARGNDGDAPAAAGSLFSRLGLSSR